MSPGGTAVNADVKGDGNFKDVVPSLRVSDMERSLRYYVDGLGLTI